MINKLAKYDKKWESLSTLPMFIYLSVTWLTSQISSINIPRLFLAFLTDSICHALPITKSSHSNIETR